MNSIAKLSCLLFVFFGSNLYAQTNTPHFPVCDRTPQVRDALVDKVGKACADISLEDLNMVTGTLNISDENIGSLKEGDFSGLSNLERLYLQNNQLTSLPDSVFSGLSELKELALYYNQLASLAEGVFSGLSNLEILTLSFNQLASLSEGVFSGLSNVKTLYLNNNQLANLPDGIFQGLSTLDILRLNNNQLANLPDGIFQGLSTLNILRLINNPGDPFPFPLIPHVVSSIGDSTVLSYTTPYGYFGNTDSLSVEVQVMGDVSTYNPSFLAGALESSRFAVVSAAPKDIQVRLSSLPDSKGSIIGIEIVGETMFQSVKTGVPLFEQSSYNFSLLENQAGSMSVGRIRATDPDMGNGLTYELSGSSLFSIGDTSGVITYEGSGEDYESEPPSYRFSAIARDGKDSAVAYVKVTITNVNETPVFNPSSYSIELAENQEGPVVLDTVMATDADGDALTYSLAGADNKFSIGESDGVIRYIGNEENHETTPTITFSVVARDEADASDTAGFTVTITNVGELPYPSVCHRTPKVRDALVAEVNKISGVSVSDCNDVTVEHLAMLNGEIYLRRAEITSLKKGDFNDLYNITQLDLRVNDLVSLPDSIFSHLSNLTELKLQTNDLVSLSDGVFRGLDKLETLRLRDNDLVSLPDGVFRGLSNLNFLDIGMNTLVSLPDSVFRGLSNLNFLDLGDGNDLVSLPESVFRGLSNLATLYLDQNELERLPDGLFEGLTALNTLLWLNDNPGADFEFPLIPHVVSSIGDSTVLSYTTPYGYFGDTESLSVEVQVMGEVSTYSIPFMTGALESSSLPIVNAAPKDIKVRLSSVPDEKGDFRGVRITETIFQSLGMPIFDQPSYSFMLLENRKGPVRIGRVTATDPDGDDLTYGVLGNSLFSIDSTSGEISYIGGRQDHETTPSITFSAVARGGEDSSIVPVDVSITDVNDAPVVADSIPSQTVIAGVDSSNYQLDISSYFSDEDEGDELSYRAESNNISVLGASINGNMLSLGGKLSLGGNGGGSVRVKIIAEDEAGDTVSQFMSVLVIPGPNPPVCDRTPQVHNALVNAISGVSRCEDVTVEHLAMFSGTLRFGEFTDYSDLTSLKKGDFNDLYKLTVLRLSKNKLTALPDSIFSHLANLTELSLSANEFERLPDGVFNGLSNLNTLNISANHLDSLSDDVFSGLGELKELSLYNNELERVPDGVFSDLVKLERLHLGENNLERVPEGVVRSLSNLNYLDIGINDLVSLPSTVFRGLSNLATLYLDQNELERLPDGLFEGLTALNDVFLGSNPGTNSGGNFEFPLIPHVVSSIGDSTVLSYTTPYGYFGHTESLSVEVQVMGEVSTYSIPFMTGALESSSFTVVNAAPKDIRVRLSSVPDEKGGFRGVKITGETTFQPLEIPVFDQPRYSFMLLEHQKGPVFVDSTIANFNGDTVAYSISDSSLFSIDPSSGVIIYEGDGENYESGPESYSFSATAFSGGYSTVANVRVTITNVNEFPIFGQENYTFELAENQDGRTDAIVIDTVTATDVDNEALRYSLSGADNKFDIDSSTGVISYIGSGEDFESDPKRYDFSAVVRDGAEASDTAGVEVTITNANDAPVFVSSSYSFMLLENQDGRTDAIGIDTVMATDVDGDALTYSLSGADNKFKINLSSGVLSYVGSGEDYETTPIITFSAVAHDSQDSAVVPVEVRITDIDESLIPLGTIPEQDLALSDSMVSLEISGYFRNTSDDEIDYRASSNNLEVVRVGLEGDSLTLSLVNTGNAMVTVTASTPSRTVMQRFMVDVTDPPTPSVCDRTPQVRDAIVAAIERVDDCKYVTAKDLADYNGEINVSKTGITSLKSGDFAGLYNTSLISFNDNNIETLPEDLFEGLVNLSEIDMSNNPLESFPENLFQGLSGLRYLSFNNSVSRLRNYIIPELPVDLFKGLSNLYAIHFTDQRISSLPKGIFRDLRGLKVLIMRGNVLTKLPDQIFVGLDSLLTLDIRDFDTHLADIGIPGTSVTLFDVEVKPIVIDQSVNQYGEKTATVQLYAKDGMPALVRMYPSVNGEYPSIYGGYTSVFSEYDNTQLVPFDNGDTLSASFEVIQDGNSPIMISSSSILSQYGSQTGLPNDQFSRYQGVKLVYESISYGFDEIVFDESSYEFTLEENINVRTLVGTVSATSKDGTTPIYSLLENDKFTIDRESGEIWYVGMGEDYESSEECCEITAVATVGIYSDKVDVTVTITNVNEFPPVDVGSIPNQILILGADSLRLPISGYFRDDDGDTLSYSAESNKPSVVGASINGDILSLGGKSIDSTIVQVIASDGMYMVSQYISVEVTLNIPPVFEAKSYNFTLAENAARGVVVDTVMATDTKDDSLRYGLLDVVDGKFSIDSSSGVISYRGDGEDYETLPNRYLFSAVVRDDDGVSDTVGVTVTITNVNEFPPVAVDSIPNQTLILGEDSLKLSISGYFRDDDADTLSYMVESKDPSVVDVSINGNILSLGGKSADSTIVQVIASDGMNTVSQDIRVLVLPFVSGTQENIIIYEGDVEEDLETGYSLPQRNDGKTYVFNDGRFEVDSQGKIIIKAGSTLDYESTDGKIPIEISLSGDEGGSVSMSLELTITNLPPVFRPLVYRTPKYHGFSDTSDPGLLIWFPSGYTIAAFVNAVDSPYYARTRSISSNGVKTRPYTVNEFYDLEQQDRLVYLADDPGGGEVHYRFKYLSTPDRPDSEGPVTEGIDNIDHFFLDSLGYIHYQGPAWHPEELRLNHRIGISENPSYILDLIAEDGRGGESSIIGPIKSAWEPPFYTYDGIRVTVDQNFPDPVHFERIVDSDSILYEGEYLAVDTADRRVGIDVPYAKYTGVSYYTVRVGRSGQNTNTPKPEIISGDPENRFIILCEAFDGIHSPSTIDFGMPYKDPNYYVCPRSLAVPKEAFGIYIKPGAEFSAGEMINLEIKFDTYIPGREKTDHVEAELAATPRYQAFLFPRDTLVFNVKDRNEPPRIDNNIPDQTLILGADSLRLPISGYFIDDDGDTLSYRAESNDTSVVGVSIHGDTLSLGGKSIDKTVVQVIASDGIYTVSQDISVEVVAASVPNMPPAFGQENYTFELAENHVDSVIGTVTVMDAVGDSLTYSLSGVTDNKFSIDSVGAISYLGSGENFESDPKRYDFSAVVRDEHGAMDTAYVKVTITDVNDAPIAFGSIPIQSLALGGDSVKINLSNYFSDEDVGDALRYSAESNKPSVVGVSINGDTLSLGGKSVDSTIVQVIASDGMDTVSQYILVEVVAASVPNMPPAFGQENYTFELAENHVDSVIGTVTVMDAVGDSLTYSLSGVTDNKFSIDSVGAISYLGSGENFESDPKRYDFSAVVRDEHGAMDTAYVKVTITNVNDAPVAFGSIPIQTLALGGDSVKINLSSYFSDEDGDTLMYTSSSYDENVFTLTIKMDTLVLAPVAVGSDTITITASDNSFMATQRVSINVIKLNDGDDDGYIDISKPSDFILLKHLPKGRFELINDIDMAVDSSVDFFPLSDKKTLFAGELKGNDFTVKNFVYSNTVSSFFGAIDTSGIIRDICITYASLSSPSDAAILAIENRGEIINSCVWGDLEGSNRVGGMVAYNKGVIKNSYALVYISATSSSTKLSYYGGLVGVNSGEVINTYAVHRLPMNVLRGTEGGLIGKNLATGMIQNSYAVGEVPVDHYRDNIRGFFVGNNMGTIVNSYWDVQWDIYYGVPGFEPNHVGEGSSDGITHYTFEQMIGEEDFLGTGYQYINNDYPRLLKADSSAVVYGNQNSYMSHIVIDAPSGNVKWNMLSFMVDDVLWDSYLDRGYLYGYKESQSGGVNMYYDYDGKKWIPDPKLVFEDNDYVPNILSKRAVPGKGFILHLYRNKETIITYGYPNVEDVVVPLYQDPDSLVGYFNLLGNPYDSELPVSLSDVIGWGNADGLYTYQTFYWNGDYYVTSLANPNPTIPINGGFFVYNTSANSLTIPYSGATAQKSSASADYGLIVVSVDGYNSDRSRHALDEVILMYSEASTLDRDKYDLELAEPFYSYDKEGAYKLLTGIKYGDEQLYRIVSNPLHIEEKMIYDLAIRVEGGLTDIEFSLSRQNIPETWLVYIEDVHTGERQKLTSEMNYKLSAEGNETILKATPNQKNKYLPPQLQLVNNLSGSALRIIVDPTGDELALPPENLSLHQNYPNPFNPITVIPFDIPERSEVSLHIYNILGQQVTTLLNNKVYEAGRYELTWDASRYGSGLYIYILEVGNQRLMRKLTLIK